MRAPYTLGKPEKLFVVCTAVFLTALVVAEATAGKLFTVMTLPAPVRIFGEAFDSVVMTAGVLAFPITFIVTDLLNEYFGKAGIRFVTLVGMAMIVFEFALLQLALGVPVAPISPVPGEAFDAVFGASTWIIVGSLAAYLLGQLADISLFHWLRQLTQGRHLWLRATGSTFGSQFIDTFVVLFVAFFLSGQMTLQTVLAVTIFNYLYKFVVALAATPLIYGAHWVMDRYLGERLSETLIEAAEEA